MERIIKITDLEAVLSRAGAKKISGGATGVDRAAAELYVSYRQNSVDTGRRRHRVWNGYEWVWRLGY